MSQEGGDPQAVAEAKNGEGGDNAAGSAHPVPPAPPLTPIMDPATAQRFLESVAAMMQQQQQMTADCVRQMQQQQQQQQQQQASVRSFSMRARLPIFVSAKSLCRHPTSLRIWHGFLEL